MVAYYSKQNLTALYVWKAKALGQLQVAVVLKSHVSIVHSSLCYPRLHAINVDCASDAVIVTYKLLLQDLFAKFY